MKRYHFIFSVFLSIISLSSFATGVHPKSIQSMQVGMIQSLKDVHLTQQEKENNSDLINTLMEMTSNPYSNSMVLLASALSGNERLYFSNLTTMLRSLTNLDNNPLPKDQHQEDWMQNNAFKAWMWGRVLMAADSMNDTAHVNEAKQKLITLLKQAPTANDNPAFFAWARTYLSALDKATYRENITQVRIDINTMAAIYEKSQKHDDLSNFLWETVMTINAAARVGDDDTYHLVIMRILEVTHQTKLANALSVNLQRTHANNDYPAWALSLVELAAARMDDQTTYALLKKATESSLMQAKKDNQLSEYTLARLNHLLAKFSLGRAKPKY